MTRQRRLSMRLRFLNRQRPCSDGHCVNRAKPAPDVFLYAAGQLGVNPTACVVVEDAEAGVDAALEINMIAVGIGPEDQVGKAHFRYPAVADVNIGEILGY